MLFLLYGEFQELISEGITHVACKCLRFCSETWESNGGYE